eukprot:gene9243-16393_t
MAHTELWLTPCAPENAKPTACPMHYRRRHCRSPCAHAFPLASQLNKYFQAKQELRSQSVEAVGSLLRVLGYGDDVLHRVTTKQPVYPPSTATNGAFIEAKVGDKRLQLSHDEQLQRGQRVVMELEDAKTAGCKGLCVLPLILPYVDYNNFFIVPAAHALLYGVVKSFVQHMFRTIPKGEVNCPSDALSHKVRSMPPGRVM